MDVATEACEADWRRDVQQQLEEAEEQRREEAGRRSEAARRALQGQLRAAKARHEELAEFFQD